MGASVTLVPERVGTRAEQTTTHASAKLEFIRATTNHQPGPQGSGFFLFAAFPSLIPELHFPSVIPSVASAFACERRCGVEGSLPAFTTTAAPASTGQISSYGVLRLQLRMAEACAGLGDGWPAYAAKSSLGGGRTCEGRRSVTAASVANFSASVLVSDPG